MDGALSTVVCVFGLGPAPSQSYTNSCTNGTVTDFNRENAQAQGVDADNMCSWEVHKCFCLPTSLLLQLERLHMSDRHTENPWHTCMSKDGTDNKHFFVCLK